MRRIIPYILLLPLQRFNRKLLLIPLHTPAFQLEKGVEHLEKARIRNCNSLALAIDSSSMARQNPNIVITGTPGVGKTTHAEQLARATGFKHISINQIVKDEGFHEGKDEETGSWIVDEDKVRNTLSHLLLLPPLVSQFPTKYKRRRLTHNPPPTTAPRSPRNAPSPLHRRLHPRLARLRSLPRTLDRPRHRTALRLDDTVRPAYRARVQGQEARGEYGQ